MFTPSEDITAQYLREAAEEGDWDGFIEDLPEVVPQDNGWRCNK